MYCPPGQVVRSATLYGIYHQVDEEHVNIGCVTISSGLAGSPQWVEAPNAWDRLYGGHKQAVCPAGKVMVGARYYAWYDWVDEEYTDVLCDALASPLPVVNVYFSMNN